MGVIKNKLGLFFIEKVSLSFWVVSGCLDGTRLNGLYIGAHLLNSLNKLGCLTLFGSYGALHPRFARRRVCLSMVVGCVAAVWRFAHLAPFRTDPVAAVDRDRTVHIDQVHRFGVGNYNTGLIRCNPHHRV